MIRFSGKTLLDSEVDVYHPYQKQVIAVERHSDKALKIQRSINITQKSEELLDLWNNFKSSHQDLSEIILSDAHAKECFKIIHSTFKSLKELKNDNLPEELQELHNKNIVNIFSAVQVYFSTLIEKISKLSNDKIVPATSVESQLFLMAFTFEKTKSKMGYSSSVYPVYLEQKKFLETSHNYVLFESSTGSGKTRCVPFFFSLRSFFDGCNFFIMTQPSTTIATDRVLDLKKKLKGDVIITNSTEKIINLYKDENLDKPVIGVFSPLVLLKTLSYATEMNINIFDRTRFCLDEIHERHVETDVVVSILQEKIATSKAQGGHLILMSATPDSKVVGLFRHIDKISLKDKALFNVSIRKQTIEDVEEATDKVSSGIFGLIEEMLANRRKAGHILCFLPGNKMIKEVMSSIHKRYIYDQNIAIFKYQFEEVTKYDDVFEELKKFAFKNQNKQVIFPIKLAGFSTDAEKKIAKKVLPQNFEHRIIKVICATNAVESSITIPNVAAVVDSGLHNSPLFDSDRGITLLSIKSITKKMQTQRAGRVGRTRPGKVIQITIQGEELPEDIPPDIVTNDISLSIIRLRALGIKLEDLKRLPDNPGKNKLNATIRDLKSLSILDENGDITDFGKEVVLLQHVSPLFGAAIIKTANKYEEYDPQFVKCVGAFIVFIMSSSMLIVDPHSKYLEKNFCPESDIVTIAKTFSECVKKKKDNFDYVIDYGLKKSELTAIYEQMSTVYYNFTKSDVYEFWGRMDKFFEENNIITFINAIIDHISKVKPQWFFAHTAKFSNLQYNSTGSKMIYHNDNSNSPEMNNSVIYVEERPGNKGFITPMNMVISRITKNNQDNKCHGSILHCMEPPKAYELCTPYMVVSDNKMFLSEFFRQMLDSYFAKSFDGSLVNLETTNNKEETHIFNIIKWQDKSIMTFIPKDNKIIEEVNVAVNKITSLMPFVAKSIISENYDKKYFVEVFNYGSDEYSSEVYSLLDKEKLPKCFNITKETIDFLYSKKLKELANINNKYRIALTGESLSYNAESSLTLSSARTLSAYHDCDSVFGSTFEETNRLVLMIANGEEMPNSPELRWEHSKLELSDSGTGKYIRDINNLLPGVIEANYKKDVVCFRSTDEFIVNNQRLVVDSLSEVLTVIKNTLKQVPYFKVTKACFKFSPVRKEYQEAAFEMFKQIADFPHKLTMSYLCCCVETNLPNDIDERSSLVSKIVSIAEQVGMNFINFEVLPITTITIFNKKSLNLDFKGFMDKITGIYRDKYGRLCNAEKRIYKDEKDKSSPIKGYAEIEVYSPDIALCIAEDLKERFKKALVPLKIPELIIPRAVYRRRETKEAIIRWCNSKNLKSIVLDNEGLKGDPREVNEALKIIKEDPTQISLPLTFIKIPSTKDKLEIANKIREENRDKERKDMWEFDAESRGLILPTNDVEKAKELLDISELVEEDVIGCLMICDERIESSSLVSIYYKDESVKTKPLCIYCTLANLQEATSDFYSIDEEINFDALKTNIVKIKSISVEEDKESDNEIWPKCPLGQLFWVIKNDEKTKNYVRVWLTAVISQTAHSNKNVLVFCPDHPDELFPVPKTPDEVVKCNAPDCQNWYCFECKDWHNTTFCTKNAQKKKCPKCGVPTEKIDGCNHITCTFCGCHWCYICGAGPFNTSGECYNHLETVHGNYFDPGTPQFNDYRIARGLPPL